MKKPLLLLVAVILSLCFSAAFAEFSDDLYSFSIQLQDSMFTLPCDVSALTQAGWAPKSASDTEDRLSPRQYTYIRFTQTVDFATKEIYVYFYNNDNCVKNILECPVSGIEVNAPYKEEDTIPFTLPKGISNAATQADIIAAYGDPTDLYEGTSYNKLTYRMDSYQEIALQVGENGLESIEVRNFQETDQLSPVSQEVPQANLDYVAPSELGDDLLSFIVSYDGDLYQLPAPISAFEQNGYSYKGARSDSIAANDSVRVELMRNNQSVAFYASNNTDVAILPQNGTINSIDASGLESEPVLILPGGIKRGMPREEMEALIKNLPFEKKASSDKYDCYSYYDSDSKNRIYIYVVNESNLVGEVEVRVK